MGILIAGWYIPIYGKDELKFASFVELGTQIKRQPWWYLGGTGCLVQPP